MTQRTGMSRVAGTKLDPVAHLKQSVTDILTTRIGSRVMRRDYGSDLLDLIDRPMNASTIAALYAVVAQSLRKWEPRLRLRKIDLDLSDLANGHIALQLTGVYLLDGSPVQIEGVVV